MGMVPKSFKGAHWGDTMTCEGYDRIPDPQRSRACGRGWKACIAPATHVTVSGANVCERHLQPDYGRMSPEERGRRGGIERARRAAEKRAVPDTDWELR